MIHIPSRLLTGTRLLVVALIIVTAVYWPGLNGSWLFDDYPNIVDNHGVQPQDASVPSLVRAALSSPSSSLKRPLASLSFAANYLLTGLDPFWMKLTNLVIHLLNGVLVFLLARALLLVKGGSRASPRPSKEEQQIAGVTSVAMPLHQDEVNAQEGPLKSITFEAASPVSLDAGMKRAGIVAALISASWMLLPLNLTGVLYVVQRMESLANLFVVLGLIGYIAGRRRMLDTGTFPLDLAETQAERISAASNVRGFILCVTSITVPAAIGILAKETAVMLPLYALLTEWILFRFKTRAATCDRRVIVLFLTVLALPMVMGLFWLLPSVLEPGTWATRDFTLVIRLLSETRIVTDYVIWTLIPTPDALSFYHDDFRISTSLLAPWTTLASIAFLCTLIALVMWLRRRQPLASLGLALFLGCQLLTGTILPLELVYEHRNYFASFGLMMTVIPLLTASRDQTFSLSCHLLLAGLMICWASLTATTAYAWGNTLRLAEELASRAPESPRAQYELGRTYIIYSHYDPSSPFTQLAYVPLEKAAALPEASILAEQAMIFMNARMQIPIKDAWWNGLIAKLKSRRATVQDESSMAALTQCARERKCRLPQTRMMQAFAAALIHSDSSARLHATYSDYCWNVMGDKALGMREIEDAIKASPSESAYRISHIRMLAAQSKRGEALVALEKLKSLNYGGRLDDEISQLRALPQLKLSSLPASLDMQLPHIVSPTNE